MKLFNKKFGLMGWLLLITTTVFAAKIGDNILRIGDPIGFDIVIKMGQGQIKWNSSDSKLQFSTDNGVSFKDIGSGSGSGGGSNFNNAFGADDNGSFEDGLAGYSFTAGTVVVDEADPLEGSASAVFTPSAQNDFFETPVVSVNKDIFRGRSCQVQVEYIGGDENMTMSLVDGNGLSIASKIVNAHSVSAPESLFFICPSNADLIADPNLGNLKIRFDNTEVALAPAVKADKIYIGTLIGLSEVSLPDTYHIATSSAGAILQENVENSGITYTRLSVGKYRIDYSSLGLTVLPTIHIQLKRNISPGSTNTYESTFESTSLTQAVFEHTRVTSGATNFEDSFFDIQITKMGVDAKQTAQVYTSVPRISENVNSFQIVNNANGTFATASPVNPTNCAITSTGTYSCTYINALQSPAGLTGSVSDGNGACINGNIRFFNNTNLGFSYNVSDADTGVLIDCSSIIKIDKGALDFRMPIVQPIVVGQVRNTAAELNGKTVFMDACSITSTANFSTTFCPWIDSVIIYSNTSGNKYRVTFSEAYKSLPKCFGTRNLLTIGTSSLASDWYITNGVNFNQVDYMFSRDSGVSGAVNHDIFCIGER